MPLRLEKIKKDTTLCGYQKIKFPKTGPVLYSHRVNFQNPYTKLPESLKLQPELTQASFDGKNFRSTEWIHKSAPTQLTQSYYDGKNFKLMDEDGDVWTFRENGIWEMRARFPGGDGTASNPFKIENARQLWMIRTALYDHFELVKDIDLSVVTEREGFKPISSVYGKYPWNPGFLGMFDGKGKKSKT